MCPSRGCASISLSAIMPAAPVLFSTTTGWPSDFCNFSAMTRAGTSARSARRKPNQYLDRLVRKILRRGRRQRSDKCDGHGRRQCNACHVKSSHRANVWWATAPSPFAVRICDNVAQKRAERTRMPKPVTPDELKTMLTTGLLSFPLTDFDANDAFDPAASARRLEWLAKYDSAPLFMAGGAGEFFSLTRDEYSAVIKTAVDVVGTRQPVVAGAGYGTKMAIAFAQEAERLGAAGLLLMAPYLAEGSQAGLRAHVTAVCRATRLGVIVYNRANCKLTVETLSKLADDCPNLIGFKDGVEDIPQLVAIRAALGNRLAYLNGMPTAETFAPSFRSIGMPTYSSAIFNFIPRTAIRFHQALNTGDQATIDILMASFLVPYVRLRGRQPGYAVSIIKAGAKIVGRGAGPVRPPLSELTPAEYEELAALIAALGPQD